MMPNTRSMTCAALIDDAVRTRCRDHECRRDRAPFGRRDIEFLSPPSVSFSTAPVGRFASPAA
jgi:hypothetical protein